VLVTCVNSESVFGAIQMSNHPCLAGSHVCRRLLGLLGLLAVIKNADPNQPLLSVATDLGTMGQQRQVKSALFPSLFFRTVPI